MALVSRLRLDPFLLLLLGTAALAFAVPVHGAGAVALNYVVDAAIAFLFFVYGVKLAPSAIISGLSHWRLQGLVFLCTFGMFPLLGLVLTFLVKSWVPKELATGLMFICVLPSTVQSSVAFTSIARGNSPAALCSATVSNLAGLVMTPALVALLLSAHGSGFSATAVFDVAVQLLLPFAIGQAVRRRLAPFLARHERTTSFVDRGAILLIVFAAFSQGVVAGVWSSMDAPRLAVVVAFDAVLLAMVLGLTTFVARLAGLSKGDEIVLVFCGSKKSIASGIPMANILFPGPAASLIVLPVMLFHQMQLFACAALAQRYAARTGDAADRSAPSSPTPPLRPA